MRPYRPASPSPARRSVCAPGKVAATIKYDPDGATLWERREGDGTMRFNGGEHVTVDALGSVYVTGTYGSKLGTLKYDAEGNELWLSVYTSAPLSYGQAIAIDTSGSVFVTGSVDPGGPRSAFVTVKYGSVGDELWARRYDAAGFGNDPAGLAMDSDGNVYVTGTSRLSREESSEDYATVKYSTDGDELWVSRFNGPDNLADRAQAIAVDGKNGRVYVTGYSHTPPGLNATVINTVQLDVADGTQLCVMTETGEFGGSGLGSDVAVDAAGNAHITGTIVNATVDIVTIKYATGP